MNEIYFSISEYWWIYFGFILFVCMMLILDLGVFHRKAHTVSLKEAGLWTVFWISLSLLINLGFYYFSYNELSKIDVLTANAEASRLSLEFLTGFIIEKALAVDNIFIFVMIFAAFGIPPKYQHRVLFFGILGAIIFRAIFIALGSALMKYEWVVAIFGIFLALTGIKMFFIDTKPADPESSWQMRLIKKFLPVTTEFEGQKFFIRRNKKLLATPLLVALVFVEFSDIIFAIDSVPAIFAITREPMIVFVSNILAILGLRSLYFLLAGIVDRFIFLKYGLASVLVFVGLKMSWLNHLYGGKFPITWSLGIISSLIGFSIFASLIATQKKA